MSAYGTVSAQKASEYTIKGILYSPVSPSRSVSISMTPDVFIDEFQDIFAMNINRVSIG